MRSLINLFAFWLGLLVILAAAVMSGGCKAAIESPPKKYDPLLGVTELRLSDGTRCVRLYADAITCDWGSGKR